MDEEKLWEKWIQISFFPMTLGLDPSSVILMGLSQSAYPVLPSLQHRFLYFYGIFLYGQESVYRYIHPSIHPFIDPLAYYKAFTKPLL